MANKPGRNGRRPSEPVAVAAPKSEEEVYRDIVAAVKAEAAEKPPREVSGDQVSHEIARRWAEHNGREFDAPVPQGPGGLGSTTSSPPASDRRVSPVKPADEEGRKLPMPVDEKTDDD